jgi:hypothetical protein
MRLQQLVRISFVLLFGLVAAAAAPPQSKYNPRETFAPLDLTPAVNRYRSGDGTPGPDYWQNRADYTINATLDPATHSISGTVRIDYTNNSPGALDVLWLHLEQNHYTPESRGILSQGGRPGSPPIPRGFTDGMILDSVDVTVGGVTTAV